MPDKAAVTGQDDPPVVQAGCMAHPGCIPVAQAIRHGSAALRDIAGNPRLEARLLLAHMLGLTLNDLIRDPTRPVLQSDYDTLLARRTAHEPIAHITGIREFWSLPFRVSPATLIPRPDSETVVSAALAAFAGRSPPARILDLGTGTGCLLLALLTEFPSAFGIGVDLSPQAAALARDNARCLGLAGRCAMLSGSWADSLQGPFDLIVSNPPYIPAADIGALMPDVRCYEPLRALDGGDDGLAAYRMILPALDRLLRTDGIAVLELGSGQADLVGRLAAKAGFSCSIRLDYAGIARVLTLSRQAR